MTTDPPPVTERRVAPRFKADLSAELASGTVLVQVQVRDLSISGCGVIILANDPDLPDKLGGSGLLHLPASESDTFGTILSVNLRHVRIDDDRMTYGLEFVAPLPHQARKLRAVLEAVGWVDPNAIKPDIGIDPGPVKACDPIAVLDVSPFAGLGQNSSP